MVIVSRDQPEALLVHLDDAGLLAESGIRLSLATALYREESLSPGQAARFADVPLAEFMQHVSRAGIPVIRGRAGALAEDSRAATAWRGASSQRTRAR
ncbi:MAG: prevent-host-death protein [Gammaproteobacteria bacterium]|nr:prevent-host-death protein [Gammaproteobacteria bacterium]